MKKDAYYFPHFCNARHDRKIKRIQKDLGLEGYGIFFMLLEVLREQSDFKYPYSDIDLLADEFGTSTAKVEVVINNYDLFDIDRDNNFFSPKLIFYLQPYLEKSKRARKANEIRWNRQKGLHSNDSNQNPNGVQMESKSILSKNPSKVKESKVNKDLSPQENGHGTEEKREKISLSEIFKEMESELIEKAVKMSSGKLSPEAYVKTVLTDWNSRGFKKISDLPKENLVPLRTQQHEIFDRREYTKEELEAFYITAGKEME